MGERNISVRKKSIGCLLYMPRPRIEPSSQACALTRNWTHNLSVMGWYSNQVARTRRNFGEDLNIYMLTNCLFQTASLITRENNNYEVEKLDSTPNRGPELTSPERVVWTSCAFRRTQHRLCSAPLWERVGLKEAKRTWRLKGNWHSYNLGGILKCCINVKLIKLTASCCGYVRKHPCS